MTKQKSNRLIAVSAKVLGLVTVAGAGLMVITSLPEIARYIRIKMM